MHKGHAAVTLITSYYLWDEAGLWPEPCSLCRPAAFLPPRSLPLPPRSPGFSVSRLQHQTPLRIPVRNSAIPSASRREKSFTRNLKELLTPQSTLQLRASFALFCFSFFFICMAFCAWTPTIYSGEGKAAFQEGSLKKLCELFGFACTGSTNVIKEMKPLRITKFWVCLEFSEDPMPDPSRLTLALLHCSLQRCVD